MNYLYHRVPEMMLGDTLYPLNKLKDIYPEAYAHALAKYQDRKHIVNQTIPGVNWLWNDVLHLTAVHPQKIRVAMQEAGFSDLKQASYFQINAASIDPTQTIVYIYKHPDLKDKLNIANFVPYDPNVLESCSHIP